MRFIIVMISATSHLPISQVSCAIQQKRLFCFNITYTLNGEYSLLRDILLLIDIFLLFSHWGRRCQVGAHSSIRYVRWMEGTRHWTKREIDTSSRPCSSLWKNASRNKSLSLSTLITNNENRLIFLSDTTFPPRAIWGLQTMIHLCMFSISPSCPNSKRYVISKYCAAQ